MNALVTVRQVAHLLLQKSVLTIALAWINDAGQKGMSSSMSSNSVLLPAFLG